MKRLENIFVTAAVTLVVVGIISFFVFAFTKGQKKMSLHYYKDKKTDMCFTIQHNHDCIWWSTKQCVPCEAIKNVPLEDLPEQNDN